MASSNHVDILKEGVRKWNEWRDENPTIPPDLTKADLSALNLRGVNFIGADLYKALFVKSDLAGADFGGANLLEANLQEAILTKTELTEAIFRDANLCKTQINNAIAYKADFSHTNLGEANLSYSEFNEAKFDNADMQRADLRKGDFSYAYFNKANLYSAKISMATIVGADLSEVDLSEADLREANLCNATLTKAKLEKAIITGVILYGTSRDEWKINNVKCDFVFWDDKGQTRDPKTGEFEPGEFEKLYEELPKFEYVFVNGFTPIDAFVMDQVVQEINIQNPNYELRLDSFHSRGLPRAVFTIHNKTHTNDAFNKVKLSYENKIKVLEAERNTLQKCFILAIREPRTVIERLGMGDIIESKYQRGDITIVKDQATIGTFKYVNKAAEDLVKQIQKAIKDSKATDADKSKAKSQLQEIDDELQKSAPEKTRLAKYWEYITKYLPDLAKSVPWKKLIEKIFLDGS